MRLGTMFVILCFISNKKSRLLLHLRILLSVSKLVSLRHLHVALFSDTCDFSALLILHLNRLLVY
jgi:hypothetical protein